MLKVPQLDDITYEQMVQRAVNKIPTMTNQWTDFNAHDPGITVLQTYAWLVDMLNYYMNATGDVHIFKYLKLLGMKPKKARKAQAYLNATKEESHVVLSAGNKIYSGDTCFEFAKSYDFIKNPMVSYFNEVDDTMIDLTAFAGMDSEFADMFAVDFERQAVTYFGFQNELEEESDIYFTIQENPNRTPFGDDFTLNQFTWEYFGEDGWTPITEVIDRTRGFLRSDSITFKGMGKMMPYHPMQVETSDNRKHYYIRCILKENNYDILPKLGMVYTNPIQVLQQDTICSIEEFVYQGEDKLFISKYLSAYDYLIVGMETKNGYEIAFEYQESSQDLCRIHTQDTPYISFEKCPEVKKGTKLQLIRIRKDVLTDIRLTQTDGCANQQVPFHFSDTEQIAEIGITLWKQKEEGNYTYEVWNYVEDLEQSDYMDKEFSYDFEEERIVFGDGIHGVVPEQGQLICVTELVLSRFADGNVMPGEINRMYEENTDYGLMNPASAKYGRNRDNAETILKKLGEFLFTQNRMVSPEDYKQLVMRTPGLIIEDVMVVSGSRYGEIHNRKKEEQTVYLVVKPGTDKKNPLLSKSYEKMIAEYVEPYRLINTKVKLVSPNYVGVEIHGKIWLNQSNEKEEILQFLREQVEGDGTKTEFGKAIILGKMFTRLEIFESVRKVEFLSMERVGNGAVKNSRGDIILYEDAIPYVRNVEIEFC